MAMWHEKSIVNPDFPFRLYVIEPTEWPIHWHEEIEIIYVLEGILIVELNNVLYQLNERDILLIGSGDIHWIVPQPQKSRIVGIQFGLPIFDAFLFDASSKRFISPLLCHSHRLGTKLDYRAHRRIEHLIRTMVHENEMREKGYQMVMKARLYDLIVTLLRQIPMEEYSFQGKKKRLERLQRLERVFHYIDRQYGRDISLEEAAQEANISLYYFARFFKEATGKTFGRYLMEYRVKKAKWYLANTDAKVTNVAFDTGFNNTTTFNRIFKEITGVTPTEYKKGNLGG